MAVENPLHDSQPHSGSTEIFLCVQTLEWFEQFVREPHIETRPVIADVESRPFG